MEEEDKDGLTHEHMDTSLSSFFGFIRVNLNGVDAWGGGRRGKKDIEYPLVLTAFQIETRQI